MSSGARSEPSLGRPGAAGILWLCAAALLAGILAWRGAAIEEAAILRSPAPTPLIEDAEGGFLSDGESVYGSLGFWELPERVPPRLRAVAVAVEDRRFDRHGGVDPLGLVRAALHTLGGRQEGGSTIAMQAVRLSSPRPRTLFAKLEESASAAIATAAFGREEVLRGYLRLVPEGGNMYGVAYAARRSFRKPVEDLSWAEASLLMSVPQSPKRRALFDPEGFEQARGRAHAIIAMLRGRGILDAESAEAALYELERKESPFREARPEGDYHFVLRAIEEYKRSPESSLRRSTRSTLDPRIQDLAAALALEKVGEYRRLGADNLALMVADARTGAVLAYVGSANYFDQANKGSIDYCRVPRSSGSTLKPFFYALGIESGAFSPASVLPDMPLRFKDKGGEYSLADFDDSYLGPMLYRRALANSRNVPAIKVLEGVGLEDCYAWLGRLGLHDFERPADFYGYGMAIGGIYTSLDRLVEAYGCLANGGEALPLRFFAGTPRRPLSRLVSEDSARLVSLFLSDTGARLPSFANTALTHFPFPVAVKTGSSNGFRDAWALGYSRRYVAGVWVGHSDFRAMNHVAGSTAAELLLSLFVALQPEAARGVGEELFPPPRDWASAKICSESGMLAGPDCPQAALEYFPRGSLPREECRVHRRVLVDADTGELATPATPPERIAPRVVTELGPEYAAYSQARGYGLPGSGSSGLLGASLALSSPVDGARIVLDPELPSRFQTIALRASVSPPVPEIVWYVDGAEVARVGFPYEARWPLKPGRHAIKAAFPRAFVESRTVYVEVRS